MRIANPNQRLFFCDFETTGLEVDEGAVPIEVGIIVTDNRLNLLETYEALIKHESLVIQADVPYKVHGITQKMLDERGAIAFAVKASIMDLVKRHTKAGVKPILVSDNIRFEWMFMTWLLGSNKMTDQFHYCGWDTSLLLEMSGVGDPKPVHRALPDAGVLLTACIRAMEHGYRSPLQEKQS